MACGQRKKVLHIILIIDTAFMHVPFARDSLIFSLVLALCDFSLGCMKHFFLLFILNNFSHIHLCDIRSRDSVFVCWFVPFLQCFYVSLFVSNSFVFFWFCIRCFIFFILLSVENHTIERKRLFTENTGKKR